MLNSQKKEVVGFEEIAHIFLSAQREEEEDKCEQYVSAIRFIPVIGSIHAKNKSFFLKQICLEFINRKIKSKYLKHETFINKQYELFTDGSKYIFYDIDLDFLDEESLFYLEKEIFFIISLKDSSSKDYMKLILELSARNKDLIIWIAFTDCDPDVKLDNFFSGINYALSDNLVYCGVIPDNMSNYQMQLGGRVIKLTNIDNPYSKEIIMVVDTLLDRPQELESNFSEYKKFLEVL